MQQNRIAVMTLISIIVMIYSVTMGCTSPSDSQTELPSLSSELQSQPVSGEFPNVTGSEPVSALESALPDGNFTDLDR